MTKEITVDTPQAGVFYADGSAKPNPGRTTYGVHGYSYIVNPEKPFSFKYDFTTLGYFKKAGLVENKENIETDEDDGFDSITDKDNYSVKTPGKVLGQTAQENNVLTKQKLPAYPVNVYDIYGYVGENSNNHIAELEAAKAAISCAVDNNIKNIDIITDSITTVQCFNSWLTKWSENGWKKSDGSILKQVDYMKDLHQYLQDVSSQGYNYNLHWIEGHCGHYGNERADQNAEHAHNQKQNIIISRDSKSHFSYKNKRPAILYLPSLIGMIEEKRSDGKYVYITTNREKKIQLYGTKSTTAAYSVLISKTPIEDIELLYTGCRKFGVDTAKYLLVDIQKLYSKPAALDIEDLKENAFIKNDNKAFIVGTAHCYDIAVQLDTPMMVHSVIKICNDSVCTAVDALKEQKSDSTIKCHDVTDQIYCLNAKGKQEVIKSFTHTDKTLPISFNLFGQTVKEDFVPAQCLPARSVFKELEGKQIKQYLIVKENISVRSWSYIFYTVAEDFEIVSIPGYATTRINLTQEQKDKIISSKKGKK